MRPSQRLAIANRAELAKYAKSPVGYESKQDVRITDRIARSICSAICAFKNETPCWSVHTDRPNAMEWPNPHCNAPGCHQIAAEVYSDIIPGRRAR